MYESEMIFSGTKRYPQSHGSTIVETPGGDLLAAWYAGSREKGDDVVILTSRKAAEGTWSVPEVAADTPGKPEGNPVLYSPGSKSLVLFYQTIHGGGEGATTKTTGWTTCDIKYRTSRDDGASWGPDNWVRREWGYVIRTKPLCIGNRILLPTHDEINWSSLVMFGDVGLTWNQSNIVSTGEGFKKGNIEPAIVELGDGTLLMYMRSGSRTCTWQSRSSDGGLKWTPPTRTPLPNPDSAVEFCGLGDGRIVLVLNNSPETRNPLSIAISEDDCETWLGFRALEDGPGSFSYPAAIQTEDGQIHITYTYKREGIKHVAIDPAWITADPGRGKGSG
ncbi:MAG: exo-alpha-sialidase [Theionarchaea archaeon]|nr:exo-alpha-sialidase [Theionarchaea archaeon]